MTMPRTVSDHANHWKTLDRGRAQCRQRCALPEVPVVVFGSDDELDILEALIESNRQRTKTNEQMGREGVALKAIETERAKRRQGQRNDLDFVEHVPQSSVNDFTNRKSRDIAAAKLGVSGKHLDTAIKVVTVIDELDQQGRKDEAQELRKTLNTGSVRKAYHLISPNNQSVIPTILFANTKTNVFVF